MITIENAIHVEVQGEITRWLIQQQSGSKSTRNTLWL